MLLQIRPKPCRGQQTWTLLLFVGMLLLTIFLLFSTKPQRTSSNLMKLFENHNQPVEDLDHAMNPFAGINNETGADHPIVPNIVHFILFEDPQMSFMHFVCVLAALRNQRPDRIYFHTNVAPSGNYWERLLKLGPFTERLVLRHMEMPTEIFHQRIRPRWRVFHGGDIARIRVLMQYGGIFLDNDSYVVRSLDFFRRFEMTLGWDENQFLGSQILIAHKDARFLYRWLHSYDKAYNSKRWYYNAGELPTTSVLHHHPELVHRVKVLFGNDLKFRYKLFRQYWPDWRQHYTFHLLARHLGKLRNISSVATYPVVFDEYNVQNYPITFREMANEVLDFEKHLLKGGDF
ncbi:unnamed protein product [Bemisia tabaci]|uniref:Glycosyltransferase n=1 Tax=Bemisia tabaci TaxID=7038 RepID=A0A9P0CF64_BEMTA|nr:unnamed protein product [Bemisia tabaci]